MPAPMTRRAVLASGAVMAVGAAAVVGGTVLLDRGPYDVPGEVSDSGAEGRTCVAEESLTSFGTIGSARLRYDGSATDFTFDPEFHAQLVTWLADWTNVVGAAPTTIDSYGAYVARADNCHSWHAAGRAFDIAAVSRGATVQATCRTDLWGGLSSTARAAAERGYWRLAASLHRHFAYVLTYHFDPKHDNHIHVDNSVSGGSSEFDPGSRVQNQAVEAICTTLWGVPAKVSGAWDDATQQASSAVLSKLGRRGDLTDRDNWNAFLDASMRRR